MSRASAADGSASVLASSMAWYAPKPKPAKPTHAWRTAPSHAERHQPRTRTSSPSEKLSLPAASALVGRHATTSSHTSSGYKTSEKAIHLASGMKVSSPEGIAGGSGRLSDGKSWRKCTASWSSSAPRSSATRKMRSNIQPSRSGTKNRKPNRFENHRTSSSGHGSRSEKRMTRFWAKEARTSSVRRNRAPKPRAAFSTICSVTWPFSSNFAVGSSVTCLT